MLKIVFFDQQMDLKSSGSSAFFQTASKLLGRIVAIQSRVFRETDLAWAW